MATHKTIHKATLKRPKMATDELLRIARERTRALQNQNAAQTQAMLATLLAEAGWTEEEFLEAMVKDVTHRKVSGTHRRSDLLGTGEPANHEREAHPGAAVGRARGGR